MRKNVLLHINHCEFQDRNLWESQLAQLNGVLKNHIHILSYSQATLRVLESVTVKSKRVEYSRRSLNMLAKQFSLNLVWVPRHSNMPGNEMLGELARKGIFLPHAAHHFYAQYKRWRRLNTCMWPGQYGQNGI